MALSWPGGARMPILSVDVESWLQALHDATPAELGAASPARVYARTRLGSEAARWFLLSVDPDGLHAALPTVVNQLDVAGSGAPDISVRVTPDIVAGPSGADVRGAQLEIRRLDGAGDLVGLKLDIGVRLDGPIAPPDGASNAQFVVLGIDAGATRLPNVITIVAAFESTGTSGAVGATATTRVTLSSDTGAPTASPDAPLLLRVETYTGASRAQTATAVVPTTPTGGVVDVPISIPGLPGGTTGSVPVAVQISVPDEAGPMTVATRTQAQLRRPGLRPHLVPPVSVTLLSEVRATSPAVVRDRIDWRSSQEVTLVLFSEDRVTGRRTVVETAVLPGSVSLDIDPLREPATAPHVQYDAEGALDWVRLRDEKPAATEDLRHLVVHALGLPASLGLRTEVAEGKPLRIVLSRHTTTEEELPEALRGAAVLLARHVAQLPPAPPVGVPTPLALAEQTVAVDLDQVPDTHPRTPPRAFVSLRSARYARVQEDVQAPVDEPVHAGPDGGLVVDLRLAPDERTSAEGREQTVLAHRSLRLQRFAEVAPADGEKPAVHSRLIVRAGSVPDRTVVDLRTEPGATPADPGSLGLRVWGPLRWVQVLNVAEAVAHDAVDGPRGRLLVAVPATPERWVDVVTNPAGLAVTATDPVEADVAMLDPDGVDPGRLLTRVVARVMVDGQVELPSVPDGFEVLARNRGLTGRVALTGTSLPPLAVRATPQVAMLQRPATPTAQTEAVTARVYGVLGVRQGGDPGFVPDSDETVSRVVLRLHDARVNKALRVRRRERPDAAAAARDVLKLSIADLAETLTVVSREGPPRGDERRPVVLGTRRPTTTSLTLSRTTGRVVLWSEPDQRPHDGPRSVASQSAGTGVLWLSIDALPRRLEVTPLFDARYVPDDETRPRNWPAIPSSWTRDGIRLGTSDPLTVREVLQGGWDRDKTDGTATRWGLTYIRLLRLVTDPMPDGGPLRRLWVWNPSRRLDDDAFDEPNSVLGVRVDSGLLLTLDLDKYEQSAPGTPHWDDLPPAWPLLAEVQFQDYGGEVSVGKELGTFDPTIGGAGPGSWWVRSVDGWLFFLGGGSAALGNTGGPPYHKDRIFS